jgi:hypothetical protein
MALTAKQRNALPDSAFALPSKRLFPVPNKAQARKAGIPEAQRLATIRNGLSRSAQSATRGSYPTVARLARIRAGDQIPSVSRTKGTITHAGKRTSRRGRR